MTKKRFRTIAEEYGFYSRAHVKQLWETVPVPRELITEQELRENLVRLKGLIILRQLGITGAALN